MKSWFAAAVFCFASCSNPFQQKPVPELPQLHLDQFLPVVREEISKAYEAATGNPRDAGATGKLGMVLHAHEQYAAAAVCYARAEAVDPKTFAWPYYLAAVHAKQGNSPAAIADLERALHLDPSHRPAQRKMAELLLDAGRTEQSAASYRKLTEIDPNSAEAWYGLGRVQSVRGETASARVSYRRACELFPTYGAAQYALALALQRDGKAAEAQEHFALYEKYKLVAPPMEDALLEEVGRLNVGASSYLREGAELEAQGKLAESIDAHLKAIQSDPNSEQAHINLISLYSRLGQPDKAEEHYKLAVALNPSRAESYYNYGVLQFSRKRFAEAKAAFARALALNPHYAQAHNNMGYLLEAEGRQSEAAGYYKKALEDQPGFRLAHFHLGRLLLNQRSYAEAIGHFEKTLTPEDEKTPGYLYVLGGAYGRSGNRKRALDYLRRAREQASARGQTQLLASIDRDLRTLEHAGAR